MGDASLKAYVINEFGGPEVFETVEMADPVAGEGEVLIEVRASSVNPVDYKIRDGRASFLSPPFPAILHPDCAGIVRAVGGGVSGFAPGDEVYTFASGVGKKPGALADLMVADARMVAPKPAPLSMEEAAALPLVAVTAWYCLVDKAAVGPGTSVFVEGGTGGVGHVAIQIAKARGATVFAACGTDDKCRIAEELGADRAFNYRETTTDDMVAASPGGRGFDVVFNTPGAPSVDHAVGVAAFGGTILDILGDFPVKPGFQMKWLSFVSVFAGRSILMDVDQQGVGDILRAAADLVESGQLRPLIDPQRFTFSEVGRAHRYAEHDQPAGKVVLSHS